MEEELEPIERIKSVFDELSSHFDSFSEMLQGRVYGYVTWEHLKKYLPEDKNSLILDAGGGTGKWALPLAKMRNLSMKMRHLNKEFSVARDHYFLVPVC